MNNKSLIVLSITTFFISFIFFGYNNEWIIIKLPNFENNSNQLKDIKKTIKKNIKLYYWCNSKWNSETMDVIFSEDEVDNLQRVVSSWLNLIDEEKIIDKKVSLQHALSSLNNQEAYVSFDRNLFNDESSTYEKLLIIESLLKTVRDNDIKICKINFLIHNQEMKDNHLDFSHPWPVQGFLKI